MAKTFLVTGAAGYIGSAVTKALLDWGFGVVAVDDLSKGEKKYLDGRARFFKIDLLDKEKLSDLFAENKIDLVIHLAAKKSVHESEKKPLEYFENNITGTVNLLDAMSRGGCKRIFFSSSASVYKNDGRGVYSEGSDLLSSNVYGFTKIKCEELIREFSRVSDMRYVIFRYFNVAGDAGLGYAEKDAQNIFPKLCGAVKNSEDFYVFGGDHETPDGTSLRDYIGLRDLVDAHIKALEYPENGIFNLGTGKGTSVMEIVKEFERQLNRKIKVKTKEKKSFDPSRSLSNSEKVRRKLNWEPEENLAKIVKDFIKVYGLK